MRSAAITFAENESSWREVKRAKRESTGTGTLLSDQPMAAEDEALGHIAPIRPKPIIPSSIVVFPSADKSFRTQNFSQ